MGGILNARVLFLLALLGITAAVGWWVRDQIHTAERDQARADAPTAPDYYMENFTVRAMNPQGTLRYTLAGTDMLHYAQDDHADLTAPHATFHRPDGPPYVLEAERGRISSGGEQVDLLGRVEIDRQAGRVNRPLHVITRDARVFPERDYVESDEFTIIRSDRSHIEGTGLRAWLDERRMRLLSQVTGTYEPQQK